MGDLSVSWRGLQQDQRFVADSGDPADLIDKTGYASDPEWTWDLTVGWAQPTVKSQVHSGSEA